MNNTTMASGGEILNNSVINVTNNFDPLIAGSTNKHVT
jgi:hypothetical protein